MKILFAKMSGAGNDFVVIDNRSGRIARASKLAKRLCDRKFGIGADGLLLVERSKKADFRMMYYNADGSYGGMCGNGGRCIARYAVLHGIAPAKHTFEALEHIYSAVVSKDTVTLRMKNPGTLEKKSITLDGCDIEGYFIDTGSPHVVIPLRKQIESAEVEQLGRKLRYHRAFHPKGTNVNFISRLSPNGFSIRTYERGVEAETLACGTGSIASAIVSSRIWKMNSPVTVLPLSGKKLKVRFDKKNGLFENIFLQGPAEITFEGIVKL